MTQGQGQRENGAQHSQGAVTHSGYAHTAVLLAATVHALVDSEFTVKDKAVHQPKPSLQRQGVFVDGTFGRGGHSRYLLSHLAPAARLLVFDRDPEAFAVAQALSVEDPRVLPVHAPFSEMAQVLAEQGIDEVQGVMMDLGVSSPQLDDASRGFSFMRDGPLDMRMDTSRGLTAADWLNSASVDEITGVIRDYGEERNAFQIAKTIVNRRQSQPLRTTHELAELVSAVVKSRQKGHHPATRTFQAIRIYLNQELEELEYGLASALTCLAVGGRLAVISFHSLEDRKVKQTMAQASTLAPEFVALPVPDSELPQPPFRTLGKLTASAEEVAANPRARSAILRVAQRVGESSW